jgi:hypothetical protein
MGEKRNGYRIFETKPEGKKPRHRQEDNIQTDFKKIRCEAAD